MNRTWMGLNLGSLLPACLIAGLGIATLSNIPLVACFNLVLFGWVWGGAIAAVAMYRWAERGPALTTRQFVLIGAAAGVTGALLGALAVLELGWISAGFFQGLRDMAGRRSMGLATFLTTDTVSLLRLLRDLVIYSAAGALGGLIASRFGRRRAA